MRKAGDWKRVGRADIRGIYGTLGQTHIENGKRANLSFLAPLGVQNLRTRTALVKRRDESIDARN
jgi:hypothetical protein